MKIGQNIYLSRKRKGISQEELANLLEVSRQSISLWETDQTVPTLDKLQSICKILDVSLDELTGLKPIGSQTVGIRKVASKEEIRKMVEANNIKFEKISFYVSFINFIFWRIGPLGIISSIVCLILSLISIKQKQTKYSLYTLVISCVGLLASIVCCIYFL